MRWLRLLASLWLVVGPAAGLLAPPLPPLPIEESIADHKFNGDGSPDEELQLSLFNEKSEFAMKSEEMDLLTDDITKKSGESREIPRTVADKGGEVEESQEMIVPIPPEPQAPEAAPPHRHPGPPSIRPPISIEITEDPTTTTTEAPTTTTTVTTTTESTTTATTTSATTTTATVRQPTEEPRVLIPIPGQETELPTKQPEEVQETFVFVPEITVPTVAPEISTQEPLILVPLPEAPEIPDTVKEASFHENSEDFTTEGPETTPETTPLNEEFFFDTQEPLVTIPVPDATIIPTIPNRITIKHRVRVTRPPVVSTTTEEAPAAIVFEPEKEEDAIRTTLPTPIELRITETELVDELVKGLPHVGTTIKSRPVTVIPPRAQPTPSSLTSTRQSGDVTVTDRARVLHRGQAKKFRRTKKLRTRRPMRIRPTTIQPKSTVFRNSSDVIHRVRTHKKKIRRLRKKKLGESRRLLTTIAPFS